MPMLTDKIKETIAEVRPGIVATADKHGKPNVSAKGSVRVLDDDHLVFADISSARTIANLRENPSISVLVLHPKSMRGCRIWGQAEVLDSGEPIGRRLDVLIQEFNREANTLSSKSQDIRTTQAAVDIKVLVEQMREQAQNIE